MPPIAESDTEPPSPPVDTRTLMIRATDEFLPDGLRLTVTRIRQRAGRGSAATINAALNAWWSERTTRLKRAQCQQQL